VNVDRSSGRVANEGENTTENNDFYDQHVIRSLMLTFAIRFHSRGTIDMRGVCLLRMCMMCEPGRFSLDQEANPDRIVSTCRLPAVAEQNTSEYSNRHSIVAA
jgi:hypothetical protein